MLFNIAADELPILLAETEEHLQTLDEGLVRLERESHDPELLQAVFRAAHTLKGNAGVVGHKRMANLTHALETLLDSLRRKTLALTPCMVDASLEALDVLKLLHDEVVLGTPNPVEIDPLVKRLLSYSQAAPPELLRIWPKLEAEAKPSSQTEPDLAIGAEVLPSTSQLPRPNVGEKTIRTSVKRLDKLMNLVGELITDRNRLQQWHRGRENHLPENHAPETRHPAYEETLSQTILHLSRITDQLQDEVMQIRLLPIANIFNKFPRAVRDLARIAGKEVELQLQGADTELDRSLLEMIGDPLLHLLRNAVDHGLETPSARVAAGKAACGRICLSARHEAGHITLILEDDGRGIDVPKVTAQACQKGLLTESEAMALTPAEALNLIFAPGLSTAEAVSEISGRGVGLDIVRTNIEQLKGQLQVQSWPGQGTRFQITLPLTLAIIPTLLVGLGDAVYALPMLAIVEAQNLRTTPLNTVAGHPVAQLRERVLPLVSLADVLGLPQPHVPPAASPQRCNYIVVVRWGNLEMGLSVEALLGEQELVVKSLGPLLGSPPGIAGAAILGDGRVALIVDFPSLFKLAAPAANVYCK